LWAGFLEEVRLNLGLEGLVECGKLVGGEIGRRTGFPDYGTWGDPMRLGKWRPFGALFESKGCGSGLQDSVVY